MAEDTTKGPGAELRRLLITALEHGEARYRPLEPGDPMVAKLREQRRRAALSPQAAAQAAFMYADLLAGIAPLGIDGEPPDGAAPELFVLSALYTARPGSSERIAGEGRRLRWELAEETIRKAAREGCPTANLKGGEQTAALAEALSEHVGEFRRFAGFDKPPPATDDDARELDPEIGVLRWDAALVRYLRGMGGDTGPAAAELWKLWRPDDGPVRGWLWLARALWFDKVRPALERRAAVVEPMFITLSEMTQPGNWTQASDDLVTVYSRAGTADPRPVGFLPLHTITAIQAERAAKALQTPAGKKLLEICVKTIAQQMACGVVDWEIVNLPGRSALRKELNEIKGPELTALLRGGQHFHTESKDGEIGGLFLWHEWRAAPGRPAGIKLQWHKKIFENPDRRNYVFFPDPDRELADLGRNQRGKVTHADWWLAQHMTKHSVDLYQRGSVRIGPDDWRAVEESSGLKKGKANALKAEWLRLEQIVEVATDRYTLPDHDARLPKLIEQGRRRVSNSAAGKRGAAKRAKDRNR